MRRFLLAALWTLVLLFFLAVAAGGNIGGQEIQLALLLAFLVGLLRIGVPWGWSLLLKRRATGRTR